MRWSILLLLFIAGCQPASMPSSGGNQTDVCIYGATPGGIAAALAAAKAGADVVLLEPTNRIGGMITNGLSHPDFHSFEALSGAFLDFSRRVEAHYAAEYGADSEQVTRSFEGTSGEPKVNLLILEKMLAEYPQINLYRQAVLVAVASADSMLTTASFTTPQGEMIVAAKVFIDGSYEGDLMAMAGVAYRVGREGRNVYGESLAPETGDDQLQGYNFRLCATNDPENRAPVAAPKGYRRDDFLDLLPILHSGEIERVFGYPSKCIFKAQIPRLPNRKYDINDVSNGLVRLSMPGHNLAWPEGDAPERRRIFDEHLRYNVGLLYFIQNDEAVPARFREEAREWGWCKDEFTDSDHLPTQLYVREARRMMGRHIYIQQDSDHAPGDARAVLHTDAIAMSDYGNNCHGTTHEGPLIGGRHRGEFYNRVPPYQVPYGVLLPNEFNNLLVPVAASSSHVGFCGLRLEPTWMSLGQAAGWAAGLAVLENRPVPQVNVSTIQQRLHAGGAATIYVSDVVPGHPDFAAVQWWGTLGGLHALHPYREGEERGANIHGQYYEAAPGHAAELELELEESIRQRWLELVAVNGVAVAGLENTSTRGDFIRAAFGGK